MAAAHRDHVGQNARATVERVKRRALERLRGELSIDRLVGLGLEIGPGAFVARNAYLDPGHPWPITIGEDSGLSPRYRDGNDASMKRHMGHTRITRVAIGDRVFIGAGAIILPGTRIGNDSIVGAGAVMRGDIPPD